ncbi:DNA mismatch repair protein muts [Heliomicrobium modesticaldum Ice1]|uniref:DNA mismatch repair protein MutS n=1 Tax=Heliobacterium modesticaldum (strain ATCC 51547 / Ice1) TaxID=498761 RepID=B0TB11_HELMI|nr:DNA mismatch repair protein MutS [Heliomicrobium modesticaldum]ABZ85122.1 DNA mismatch repair protein muts [Heliomicrobium modesticaldum Ice1]
MKAVTPMMKQYQEIKNRHPDAILFFRLGDFYEMFGPDALLASRELEITLTGREAGLEERIPMCGVPYHSAQGYISRLVEKGYKVAICEQVEDPAAAKGIVKREIVRVVTPGTLMDTNVLEEKSNNYLVAVAHIADEWGLAALDVFTGDFMAARWYDCDLVALQAELLRLAPKELLVYPAVAANFPELTDGWKKQGILVSSYPAEDLTVEQATTVIKGQFNLSSLEAFGCAHWPAAIVAAAINLRYVQDTQKANLPHITRLRTYRTDHFMRLDPATRRNLELTRTMREGSRKGSLLGVIDKTVTAMGGRLIKRWIEQPLTDVEAICKRQAVVAALVDDGLLRQDVRAGLRAVYDLERLAGKVAYGSANGRDLIALASSLEALPTVLDKLRQGPSVLEKLASRIDALTPVARRITETLVDDPPVSVRDGGLIRSGFHPEVDELRKIAGSGKEWLAHIEQRERERTGIRSLKVGFNKVFGYFIEVSKANMTSVPADYIRRQTLANGERYITPELKTYEEKILGAEEKLTQLEYRLFTELRSSIEALLPQLQKTAEQVAHLDVFAALAQVAVEQGYVCPDIHDGTEIHIQGGRHPVVEAHLGPGVFVPNDTRFCDGETLLLITGPNMAGKSTYMRQVALIVLLAQVGSFVPATAAAIGVVDRIFTRVGASDDLATGQSTFMVEMTEVAHILHHATSRSLVVLDEVGRGTSTFDGMAIAWAVAEAIQRLGAKSLFATHYHELVRLEETLPGVRCYTIAVRESGDDIVFLHQIRPGGVNKSYGIQVARLAGLPSSVILRAREILANLESESKKRPEQKALAMTTNTTSDQSVSVAVVANETSSHFAHEASVFLYDDSDPGQLMLFGEQSDASRPIMGSEAIFRLAEALDRLDINRMTPLDALNWLAKQQKKLKRGR